MSDGYTIIGPLCYQGKENCESVICTREMWQENGKLRWNSTCRGYHCSYCDEPTGSQGHRCDASVAFLDEAKRSVGLPEPREE